MSDPDDDNETICDDYSTPISVDDSTSCEDCGATLCDECRDGDHPLNCEGDA